MVNRYYGRDGFPFSGFDIRGSEKWEFEWDARTTGYYWVLLGQRDVTCPLQTLRDSQ